MARYHFRSGMQALAVTALLAVATTTAAEPAAALPEIRTHQRNQVPACVTPQRLMRYLRTGNSQLPMRYVDIAQHYKDHGERLKIRWDYAFFQMILETNYLKFKNAAGQGDVDPRQNNFAGIGTTGGGVPGDSFPDVSTGVLAQMQHLIAYSGERVADPVGRRTREKQDDIIQRSKALGRAVTFKDLTRRWAADRRYGTSIEFVASRFRAAHCNGQQPDEEAPQSPEVVAQAAPAARGQRVAARKGRGDERAAAAAQAMAPTVDADTEGRDVARQERASLGASPALVVPPQAAARPTACKVFTASYGGQKNMLIRVRVAGEMHYTALQVLEGSERALAETFVRNHAKGGDIVSEHADREAALRRAFDLCPQAAQMKH